MTFNIRDYFDKLEEIKRGSNHIEFFCPVCGEENFKVTLSGSREGAYRCWSNSCDGEAVRKALGANSNFKKEYARPIKPAIRKIDPPSSVKLIELDRYKLPESSSYWSGTYSTRVVKTIYDYSKDARTVRVDFTENGRNRKQVYPQHFIEGDWIYGAGNSFPFYNQKHITSTDCKNGTVFVVEGEKTADSFTNNTGWLALSAPGFGWTDKWLSKNFRLLFAQGIDCVIMLPDNDQVGQDKSWKVRQACWSTALPCVALDLPYSRLGDDVADLIEKGVDVKKLIWKELQYVGILQRQDRNQRRTSVKQHRSLE